MLLTGLFEKAKEELLPHQRHKIVLAMYGGGEGEEIAIECETCCCILVSFFDEEEAN